MTFGLALDYPGIERAHAMRSWHGNTRQSRLRMRESGVYFPLMSSENTSADNTETTRPKSRRIILTVMHEITNGTTNGRNRNGNKMIGAWLTATVHPYIQKSKIFNVQRIDNRSTVLLAYLRSDPSTTSHFLPALAFSSTCTITVCDSLLRQELNDGVVVGLGAVVAVEEKGVALGTPRVLFMFVSC